MSTKLTAAASHLSTLENIAAYESMDRDNDLEGAAKMKLKKHKECIDFLIQNA